MNVYGHLGHLNLNLKICIEFNIHKKKFNILWRKIEIEN